MSGPLAVILLHVDGGPGRMWTMYVLLVAGWQAFPAVLGFWDDLFLEFIASLPGAPSTTLCLHVDGLCRHPLTTAWCKMVPTGVMPHPGWPVLCCA